MKKSELINFGCVIQDSPNHPFPIRLPLLSFKNWDATPAHLVWLHWLWTEQRAEGMRRKK